MYIVLTYVHESHYSEFECREEFILKYLHRERYTDIGFRVYELSTWFLQPT